MSAATTPNASASPLRIIAASDLLKTEFPKSDDIIQGIMPEKSKAIISGPAKIGKTFFSFGLGIGLGCGKNVMGFTIPRARRVLYCQAEMSERALQKRLVRMLASFPHDPELLRENLLLCNERSLKIQTAAARIEAAIAAHKPEVLFFDPLYKYNIADENSTQEMGRFFDPLDNLIEKYGISTVLTHHHGKGTGEFLVTPAHANRGASTIADWPDSLLTLTFEDRKAGIVKLSYTSRNDEEPSPVALLRNSETLWFEPIPTYQCKEEKNSPKMTLGDVTACTPIAPAAISYTDLWKALMARCGVCERTAKGGITFVATAGQIQKREDGLYTRKP
jgi:KaiC/GvpD/RAD55 family RecA-like ATPase